MANPYDPIALAELTRINLQDVLVSFGWQNVRFGRRLLEWPFQAASGQFARLVLDYDHFVASSGLQEGARCFLEQLGWNVSVFGQENIPPAGPLMVLSNHPGMADTVSLFAAIPRPDLKVVAADRPFLRTLKATERQLIYVPEKSADRMAVLKSIAAQLRSGGAILTFPAGQIEPDPATASGAVESLQDWATSIGALVRIVPETQIVIAIVSGVLARQAVRHPLTRLRRQRKDQERLAATLQLLAKIWIPSAWRVDIQVRFSAPIPAADLIPLKDPQAITLALIDRIRPFVAECVRQASKQVK
jgi:hypothetical protein